MGAGGVQPDDMTSDLLDDAFEQMLDGSVPPAFAGDPLVAFVADGAQALRAYPAPAPGPALREFIGVRSSNTYITPLNAAAAPVRPDRVGTGTGGKRKPKMVASTLAFAATTTGKLVLGASMALAAMGGAHASGVVDLVPDSQQSSNVAADGSAGVAVSSSSTEIAVDSDAAAGTTAAGTADVGVGASGDVEAGGLFIPLDGVGTIRVAMEGGAAVIEGVRATADGSATLQSTTEAVFFHSGRATTVAVALVDGLIRVAVDDGTGATELLFATDGTQIGAGAGIEAGAGVDIDGSLGVVGDALVDAGVDTGAEVEVQLEADVQVGADTGVDPGAVGGTAGAVVEDATTAVDAVTDAANDAVSGAVDDAKTTGDAVTDAVTDALGDATDTLTDTTDEAVTDTTATTDALTDTVEQTVTDATTDVPGAEVGAGVVGEIGASAGALVDGAGSGVDLSGTLGLSGDTEAEADPDPITGLGGLLGG